MADLKISQLPSATTPLAGSEVLPIVQSGTTKQVSIDNLTAGKPISATSITGLTTPLSIGQGGTGTSSTTFANLTTNVTGTLPIANGGTNSTATATAGGVGYGTGTAHAYTAAGTLGQVLTSAGTGAPTWTTPAGSALVYLSTVTASNVASVDMETTFNSTYETYLVLATDVKTSLDGYPLDIRMKINGSYDTGANYKYHLSYSGSNSTSYVGNNDNAGTSVRILQQIGNAASECGASSLYINNPSSTTLQKVVYFTGASINDSGIVQTCTGAGLNTGTQALTGLRFQSSGGSNISGTFRLYGIVKS
jgi:hypothetical protein